VTAYTHGYSGPGPNLIVFFGGLMDPLEIWNIYIALPTVLESYIVLVRGLDCSKESVFNLSSP
jgi:hypothetical protein